MATLERAIPIAARVHEGHVDKEGAPYVLHPVRMTLAVEMPEAYMAAMLHDVAGDTDVTTRRRSTRINGR